MGAPAYSFIISLGQADIEGGLVKVSTVYYNEVSNAFQWVQGLVGTEAVGSG